MSKLISLILLFTAILFSLFGFIEGIRLGLNNPIGFVTGLVTTFTSLLVFFYLPNLINETKFINKSIISNVMKSGATYYPTLVLLIILSIGNFTYVFLKQGIPYKGRGFLIAGLLVFISAVMIKKRKN